MRIVFENDNIYAISPLNMANEIISALLARGEEERAWEWEEATRRCLDICKTIEFLEIWRKQNQRSFEERLEQKYV